MPQPNISKDRVNDPILTAVARGFGRPWAPVANRLFPRVPVMARAGKIITFGREDFILQNTRRAPGASIQRVQFGYDGGNYSLVDHDLEGVLPDERAEEARAVPGIDLASQTLARVRKVMDLEQEYEGAKLARDATKYGTSNKSDPTGTDLWDDPASDPFTQVADARSSVRKQVGAKPDLMVLPDDVASKLRVHPTVLGRLGNADIKIATLDQLKLLFEIDIVVAEGVYFDQSANQFVDVWGTDVILACTTPASAQDMGSPAFGYTYYLEGRPQVSEPYYEPNKKSWIYPVADAYQAVLTGANSGFLMQSVIAA
jgi:hypothetical protein